MKEGIDVYSKDGDIKYGKSVKAGIKAIQETAISRFFLPFPVLFVPATSCFLLKKLRIMPKNIFLNRALEISLIVMSLTFALPMSIALFEQKSKLTRAQIDKNLKYLKASNFYKKEQVFD